MNESHTLGKFCSVAKKGTIIKPKNIPGYIAPEGQVLTENGQKMNFVYTPIEYHIDYDFAGGDTATTMKETYTIEDPDYVPDTPFRDGYMFNGWEPKSIPHGTVGDVTFIATWIPNAVLITGKELHDIFIGLAGGVENIIGFDITTVKPIGQCADISDTSTPILATFDEETGYISIYCAYDIYCNEFMNEAFKDFVFLRDIRCFSRIVCNKGTNITNIFNRCKMLADTSGVEKWADGNFSDFTGAFDGTPAMESGRVPSWYRWNENIIYMSSTGKILDKINEDRIPGETIFAKAYAGYKAVFQSLTIQSPNADNIFEYVPIEYTIEYVLNGGELLNAKTHYTIEDETYYPPEPVKPGYTFTDWDRECITSGETGNVVFIAHYRSN